MSAPPPAEPFAGSRLRALSCALLLPATLGLVLLAFHLLGWREHTSILSGTYAGSEAAALQGLAYVIAWFTFVVVAPIAALSAGIYSVAQRGLRAKLES
ncbi:MAG: hypothetical protein JKY65_12075 [Planctomycetes bacterium]|nr:hypothetical protein [Planctomycetota bacterium]